jgi:endonuclease YncB( thermonuclease family)
MITQDFFTSTWNLPAGGKWQTTGVMFKDMTTGVVHTINTDNTDVNYVVDGDTIWVNALDANGQTVLTKVRFAGIDAPELHTVDGSENLAGVASKLYLENLIKEHSPNGIVAIMVYPDPTLQIDYFNRLIGWIVCEDGTELNAAMLDAGMAQVYASTLRNAVDSTVEW